MESNPVPALDSLSALCTR